MAGRSAPRPMAPTAFKARVKREGLPKVLVLAGSEPWFRAQLQQQVIDAVLPEGDPGGALVRLDGRRTEDRPRIHAVQDELRGSSLFASERVVVIAEPDSAAAGARKPGAMLLSTRMVKETMAGAPEGAHLVLNTERGVKGRPAVGTSSCIKAGAWVVDCRALYDAPAPWERGKPPFDHELSRHVVLRMRHAWKRELPLEVAHALTQRVGRDLNGLENALASLAMSVEGGAPIGLDALEACLGHSRDDPVWTLVDAVLDGEVGRAVELADQAFERGIKDDRGLPVIRPSALFMMLHRSLQTGYLKVLAGAEALAAGERPEDITKAAGIPGFLAATFLRRCEARPTQLVRLNRALLDAELGVKGRGLPPRLAGERLVLDLARGFSAARS